MAGLLRSFPPLARRRRQPSGRPCAVVCTIIAKNYLAQARVLVRSIARSNPELACYVLVTEPIDGYIEPDDQPFEILQLEDLAIPDIASLCMRYTLTELATAVKPRFLEVLFEKTGCRNLLYLDPDILVLDSLAPLYARLRKHSILLTPHITRPIGDDASPGELTHLRCGLYNLGFLGVAASDVTRDMLAWWKRHLFEACVFRPEQGVFVDQKWMDLVPLCFPGVEIVTEPGCNVAFWNLQERRITLRPRPMANKAPLRFFHFSGYDPRKPDVISKYQDRFDMKSIGAAADLFSLYRRLLIDEGYEDAAAWSYFYDSFDNGVPVTVFIRDLFDSLGPQRTRFANPFATLGSRSFYAWINAPAPGERAHPPYVSNGLHYLWSTSALLRRQFPDMLGRDREPLLNWAAAHVDARSHPIAVWRRRPAP